ncbi:hypothetical protein LBX01_04375 [Altererythrobacter sp. N1]|nr:hypothetical protein LBX01_04375 [Altererythrobacter sp. N1]
MLATLGLNAAGFVLGVSLTAIISVYVVGLIHAEAVKLVDSHLGAFGLALRSDSDALRGDSPIPSSTRLPQDTGPHG